MEDLGGVLILLGFTAFAIALFSFFKPLPKLRLASRKASGVLAALSVGSCIAGGAVMPTPPSSPQGATQAVAAAPVLPSLKGSNKIIESVEISPPNLIVKAYIDKAWDGPQYVSIAGLAAVDIGKAMKAGVVEDGPGIEYVLIQFETGGYDRLGNDVRIDFMNLVLPAGDLRAANYTNLTFIDVLNLAHEVGWGQRAGADAIVGWCEKNIQYGRPFCMKAAS